MSGFFLIQIIFMKKYFIVCFSLLIGISCKQENTQKTISPKDSETFNLVGNVKNMMEEIAIHNDSGKMVQKYISLTFDKNQKLVLKKIMNDAHETLEEIRYEGLDQMINKKQFHLQKVVLETQYQWNSRKQLILEIKKNSKDSIVEKSEFLYEHGYLVKEIYQNFASKNNTTTHFERDKNGNILKESFENPTGQIKSVKKYTYDEQNNKIQETQLGADQEIIYNLILVYNENNLIISEKYFDATGQTIQQIEKEYDINSNIVKQSIQEQSDHIIENCIYNEKKKIIEYAIVVNGEITQTTNYTYDDFGNEIEMIDKTPQEQSVTRYQYKYDAKGNWTLKQEIQPDGTKVILTRTIEYN